MTPRDRVIRREELASFLREVEKDRVAVEHGRVTVDDRRSLRVGIDRQESRRELLPLPGVDRYQLIIKTRFLKEQGDLRRVGRGVIIEFDHRAPPFAEA